MHHQPAAIQDKPVQQKYADKGCISGRPAWVLTIPRTATGCAACNLGGEGFAPGTSAGRRAQAGGAASGGDLPAGLLLAFYAGSECRDIPHVITAFFLCIVTGVDVSVG